MQTAQTDLTIVGAHTETPAIYWKGQPVQNVTGLRVIGGPESISEAVFFNSEILAVR